MTVRSRERSKCGPQKNQGLGPRNGQRMTEAVGTPPGRYLLVRLSAFRIDYHPFPLFYVVSCGEGIYACAAYLSCWKIRAAYLPG